MSTAGRWYLAAAASTRSRCRRSCAMPALASCVSPRGQRGLPSRSARCTRLCLPIDMPINLPRHIAYTRVYAHCLGGMLLYEVSVHMSTHTSIHMPVHMPVHMSTHTSIRMHVQQILCTCSILTFYTHVYTHVTLRYVCTRRGRTCQCWGRCWDRSGPTSRGSSSPI